MFVTAMPHSRPWTVHVSFSIKLLSEAATQRPVEAMATMCSWHGNALVFLMLSLHMRIEYTWLPEMDCTASLPHV